MTATRFFCITSIQSRKIWRFHLLLRLIHSRGGLIWKAPVDYYIELPSISHPPEANASLFALLVCLRGRHPNLSGIRSDGGTFVLSGCADGWVEDNTPVSCEV